MGFVNRATHGAKSTLLLISCIGILLSACGGGVNGGGEDPTAPVITGISPTTIVAGDTVTITGTDFGTSQGPSSLTINGDLIASVVSWSDTEIVVTVPNNANSGLLVMVVNALSSNSINITILHRPEVDSVLPPAATFGDAIQINGSYFGASQDTSTVTVNGTAITNITSWSNTSIQAVVPEGATSGQIVVTVNGLASNDAVNLTVIPPPIIANVDPTTVTFGQTVTINGWFFGATQDTGTLTINGTTISSILSWSNTSIQATVPVGTTSGSVVVTAANGLSSNAVTLTVIPPPVLDSVSPTTVTHGDTFQVNGSNFGASQGSSTLTIDGTAVTSIQSWSSTEILATVPAGATSGDVVVTANALTSNGVSLTVVPTPIIANVDPTTATHGEVVEINGWFFGASQGSGSVSINGTPVTGIQSWSNTSIEVTVPAGATSGPVIVTANSLTSNSVTLTIIPTPAISSVDPTTASYGETIQINGSGFGATQSAGSVTINGATVSGIVSWSDTVIQATVPNDATSGQVVVTANSLTSNGVNLTVVPPPAITSVDPTSVTEGETITIEGSAFGATQGTSTVTINGAVVSVSSWNDTEIELTVPSGATSGAVVVTVDGRASNGVSITVIPSAPVISTVNPSEAKVGETITITGTGFGATQGASSVTVNGVAVISVQNWSATEIVATVPAGAKTGDVVVTVSSVASNSYPLIVPWTPENPTNVGISTQANSQGNPQSLADGHGGTFVVWEDYRHGNSNPRLYAQRVNSVGEPMWTANGVRVSAFPTASVGAQTRPRLVSDGNSGFIVLWEDKRNTAGTGTDVYAQRFNSFGVAQWVSDVIVSAAVGNQTFPELVENSTGGIVAVWQDTRNGASDIYAQRLDISGGAQWTNDGIAVSLAADIQQLPKITNDDNGSVIIAWERFVSAETGNHDLYLQRLDGSGVPQWTANGQFFLTWHDATLESVSSGTRYRDSFTRLLADGSGGAFVLFRDRRVTGNSNISIQRVNAAGALQWQVPGDTFAVPVCWEASGNQVNARMVSDGNGGVIVVWDDHRAAVNADKPDVYAQRINSSGVRMWENGAGNFDGIPVSTNPQLSAGSEPQIVTDGSAGAIITWQRTVTENSRSRTDIYAQRVNSAGVRQWENGVGSGNYEGIPISVIAFTNQFVPTMVADGHGGAIIVWQDTRSGNDDIYAQGITANGRQ